MVCTGQKHKTNIGFLTCIRCVLRKLHISYHNYAHSIIETDLVRCRYIAGIREPSAAEEIDESRDNDCKINLHVPGCVRLHQHQPCHDEPHFCTEIDTQRHVHPTFIVRKNAANFVMYFTKSIVKTLVTPLHKIKKILNRITIAAKTRKTCKQIDKRRQRLEPIMLWSRALFSSAIWIPR